MPENNKVFATYPSWPSLFILVQSNKNHYISENILIKTHENNSFQSQGFLLDLQLNLNTILIRSWSFWKQKYGVYGFPQKAFRVPDYKKDTDKPIINYCIVFNWHCREGSNETGVAINGKNVYYSIHYKLLVLIHLTFVPKIICAVGEQVQKFGSICFSLSLVLRANFC